MANKIQMISGVKEISTTYGFELDDADTAGVWAINNIEFEVDGPKYRIKKVCGIEVNSDEDIKSIVKHSDLTNPQKCWVLAQLINLNIQWSAGPLNSYACIMLHFEPLRSGIYGYTEKDYIYEYINS